MGVAVFIDRFHDAQHLAPIANRDCQDRARLELQQAIDLAVDVRAVEGVVDDHWATLGVRRTRHAGVRRDAQALQGRSLVGWRGDELEQAGLLLQDEDGSGLAVRQLAGGVDQCLEQGFALDAARQEAADFNQAFERDPMLGRHGVELERINKLCQGFFMPCGCA